VGLIKALLMRVLVLRRRRLQNGAALTEFFRLDYKV